MNDFKRKFGAESVDLVNGLLRKTPMEKTKELSTGKKEVQPSIFREMRATRKGNCISYFEEGMEFEVELTVIVYEKGGLGGKSAFREFIE